MKALPHFNPFMPMSSSKIITTGDGSHTLVSGRFGEQYHSTFGAVGESMHIFIEAGFKKASAGKKSLNILEIGTGTGLNLILTFKHQNDPEVNYTGIEAFPPDPELLSRLNYPQLLGLPAGILNKIYRENPGTLGQRFRYRILITKLQEAVLPRQFFDVVYFDAFSPEVQPELWRVDVFRKIAGATAAGGILTTYSAKGDVKRALKAAGFQIEKLPGPPGKREFVRATKP